MINASTTCTDSIGINGETIRSCQSNGSGYDGATYTLKFTIETVQYNKYQDAWNVDVAIAEEKPHPGTLTLLEKTNPVSITNYADGNIHEMYTFEHEATAQTPALTDYRYIGNDPYNYVYFNCDSLDNQNSETCEVWRILGVFDVEREVDDEDNPGEKKIITETRIKLVRGTSLKTRRMWDNRICENCSGSNKYGKNDWNGSLINIFLNNDYLYRQGEALDSGLKLSAQNIIKDAKYYLGGFQWNKSTSTQQIYNYERGTVRYSNTRSISWSGKVSLMYPSDMYMTYALEEYNGCYSTPMNYDLCNGYKSKSWIYNTNKLEGNSEYDCIWLLSPSSNDSSAVFSGDSMYLATWGGTSSSFAGIRPVVYLSADVQIFDGDGSEQNHYKLKK